MNKMIVILIGMMMHVALCAGGTTITEDKGSEMIRNRSRASAVWENANFYQRASGKEATQENIVNSLSAENASGLLGFEVDAAIELIILSGEVDQATAEALLACYERNAESSIRVQCIEALAIYDAAKADSMATEMLDDQCVDIYAKLFLAGQLVERGHLQGYPYIERGLSSEAVFDRLRAARLIAYFEPYDGHIY